MNRQKCVGQSADKAHTPPAEQAIPAERLFGTGRVVLIEHRGELYQLRLTQNGKLILTK